jgi:hypothetical protein
MKKKLLLLMVTLCLMLDISAQSIISNVASSATISSNSAQVSCDLYGAVNESYKIFALQKKVGGEFVTVDSVITSGLGFANPKTVTFTLDSLDPNTQYFYEFTLNKNDSVLVQTTTAGNSFTTTQTPQSGVITNVVVNPIPYGLQVIVTGNTNGSQSQLVALANQETYTGAGWVYQSSTELLPGLFTQFVDTLTITGLDLVRHKVSIRLIPLNGMPVVQSILYYGTPTSVPIIHGPELSISGPITALCGKIVLSRIIVDPADGDMPTVVVLASQYENFNNATPVYVDQVSGYTTIPDLEIPGLQAGIRYFFKAVGISVDSDTTESNVVSFMTLSGDLPGILFSVDANSMDFVGSANCDPTIVYYSIVNENNETVFQGSFLATGSIDETVAIDLPDGHYEAIVYATNSYGSTDPQIIGFQIGTIIITGVIENVVDLMSQNLKIQIFNYSGQILWEGQSNQIDLERKNQIVIVVIEGNPHGIKMVW